MGLALSLKTFCLMMPGTQRSNEDTRGLVYPQQKKRRKTPKNNEDTQCGSTVCLCKEPSGQFVWEEVQYVAGYLERGHLAWLTDNSPTARRAAVSQVLMQTQHYHGNQENEWEIRGVREGKKKKR